jgi:hypothetical protein
MLERQRDHPAARGVQIGAQVNRAPVIADDRELSVVLPDDRNRTW